MITGEVERVQRVRIVNFDPILAIAVYGSVLDAGVIGGEEFIDHRLMD